MARLCGSCLALDHVASPRYQVCRLLLHCHLCRQVLLNHMSCPILYPWICLCTVQSLLVSLACGKLSYQRLDLQDVTPSAHSVKIVSESCSSCSSLRLHGPALQLGATAAFTVFKFASGHLLSWYCTNYWKTSQKLCLKRPPRCPLPGANA